MVVDIVVGRRHRFTVLSRRRAGGGGRRSIASVTTATSTTITATTIMLVAVTVVTVVALALQQKRGTGTAGDVSDVQVLRKSDDEFRRSSVAKVSLSELSMFIGTPGKYSAFSGHRNGMTRPTRDCTDTVLVNSGALLFTTATAAATTGTTTIISTVGA